MNPADIDAAAKAALAPFERGAAGENPFTVQSELQDIMQNLVGIVRTESEMQQALDKIAALRVRAAKAGITGNIEYNTGWHTALDLDNMLSISEMIAIAALERQESRGGHFRDDYPDKSAEWGKYNLKIVEGSGRASPRSEKVPVVPAHGRDEAGASRSRSNGTVLRSRSGAANEATGKFVDYTTEYETGMVVLDVVHRSRRTRPTTWPCAGTARPASADRARPRSTASRA